eukprot:7787955-Heterocapsa_arctica.AAC.1
MQRGPWGERSRVQSPGAGQAAPQGSRPGPRRDPPSARGCRAPPSCPPGSREASCPRPAGGAGPEHPSTPRPR